jgi:hypothetical protein
MTLYPKNTGILMAELLSEGNKKATRQNFMAIKKGK